MGCLPTLARSYVSILHEQLCSARKFYCVWGCPKRDHGLEQPSCEAAETPAVLLPALAIAAAALEVAVDLTSADQQK